MKSTTQQSQTFPMIKDQKKTSQMLSMTQWQSTTSNISKIFDNNESNVIKIYFKLRYESFNKGYISYIKKDTER